MSLVPTAITIRLGRPKSRDQPASASTAAEVGCPDQLWTAIESPVRAASRSSSGGPSWTAMLSPNMKIPLNVSTSWIWSSGVIRRSRFCHGPSVPEPYRPGGAVVGPGGADRRPVAGPAALGGRGSSSTSSPPIAVNTAIVTTIATAGAMTDSRSLLLTPSTPPSFDIHPSYLLTR
jgi:hypothetical protein